MPAFQKMTKGVLLSGMNLCLRNARALRKEAEMLARGGAGSRAFVLAVLAQEEAGKVVLLTLMPHGDRATADNRTLRTLERAFVSHDSKLALLMEGAWRAVLYLRRRKKAHAPVSPEVRAAFKNHKTLYDFVGNDGLSPVLGYRRSASGETEEHIVHCELCHDLHVISLEEADR
jgi:AbiV family abortive infection protein